MNSQIIQSRTVYEVALMRVAQLIDSDPMRGTTQGDELETLGRQVQTYETQHYPVDVLNPIEQI